MTVTILDDYTVIINLSKEVLSAIKLSQINIKSPIKKQQIISQRNLQINHYNQLKLKEERELRHMKRTSISPRPPPPQIDSLSSPTKKKVKFKTK
ncbi:unnamed protein product [Candida verbasci]|uniref:Uncharacterized protein n=1 Tax=Candida verbasci TaxID=1227364 RepID=A0A9W4XNQ9_9ASCO|nr:unnamed protein product [Candida verbasci]